MSWIDKILPSIAAKSGTGNRKANVPEGVWKQCPRCDAVLYQRSLEENHDVCPKCDHHLRITARKRLDFFLDIDDREELNAALEPVDILKFRDLKKYKDRLSAAQKATGEKDALVVMKGKVNGVPLVAAAFEFAFIGGSMGAVVGEKFTQAINVSIAEKLPLVCFSTSGGARMQEALISLMQMAKTSAALEKLRQMRLPYISVLVDPVYGGVSASLAMLGDINIAEPNALVGFTGPDVIRQTVKVKLPEGFQRSEFLLEHGAIDMIVDRRKIPIKIASLLSKLMYFREKEKDLAATQIKAETIADADVGEAPPAGEQEQVGSDVELAPATEEQNIEAVEEAPEALDSSADETVKEPEADQS